MEIHKPKAAHNLREFLVEIGTITCGILIALGLEQAVEAAHWREAVSEAREALHQEIATNDVYLAERVASATCIDTHIAETAALIEKVAETGASPRVSGVAIPLGRLIDTEEWEAQQAAQGLVHFPNAERALLARSYALTRDFIRWRDEDGATWSDLSVLDGPPKRFSVSDITLLRMRLARAKELELLWARNAKIALTWERDFGLKPTRPTGYLAKSVCKPIITS